MSRLVKNRQSGMTVLEMVIAISILLAVAVAVLTLAISNSRGQKESETLIVATHLASEGIEAIRLLRDNNWLSGVAWDQGLADGTYTALFDPDSKQWTLANANNTRLYRSSEGVILHDSAGTALMFSRVLTIRSVCRADSGQESIGQCLAGQERVGISVESRVSWSETNERSTTLTAQLYAWR